MVKKLHTASTLSNATSPSHKRFCRWSLGLTQQTFRPRFKTTSKRPTESQCNKTEVQYTMEGVLVPLLYLQFTTTWKSNENTLSSRRWGYFISYGSSFFSLCEEIYLGSKCPRWKNKEFVMIADDLFPSGVRPFVRLHTFYFVEPYINQAKFCPV